MYTLRNAPQRENERSLSQKAPLGSFYIAPDGRQFRYARNGAVALSGAVLVQVGVGVLSADTIGLNAAAPFNGDGLTVGAKAVGVPVVNNNYAANTFTEGYIGGGTAASGLLGRIGGHGALVAAAANDIYFLDPLNAVITSGAGRTNLLANPYSAVIVCPASGPSRAVMGATQFAISANEYFWLLVQGVCHIHHTATPVEGSAVTPSLTVAGAVDPATAYAATTIHVGVVIGFHANNAASCWVNLRV